MSFYRVHLAQAPSGIAALDFSGVALAAIKGLNQKLEDKEAERKP